MRRSAGRQTITTSSPASSRGVRIPARRSARCREGSRPRSRPSGGESSSSAIVRPRRVPPAGTWTQSKMSTAEHSVGARRQRRRQLVAAREQRAQGVGRRVGQVDRRPVITGTRHVQLDGAVVAVDDAERRPVLVDEVDAGAHAGQPHRVADARRSTSRASSEGDMSSSFWFETGRAQLSAAHNFSKPSFSEAAVWRPPPPIARPPRVGTSKRQPASRSSSRVTAISPPSRPCPAKRMSHSGPGSIAP